ncbi:MAG: hypothetical protein R2788_10395 [Saprospiraceae bacterium]
MKGINILNFVYHTALPGDQEVNAATGLSNHQKDRAVLRQEIGQGLCAPQPGDLQERTGAGTASMSSPTNTTGCGTGTSSGTPFSSAENLDSVHNDLKKHSRGGPEKQPQSGLERTGQKAGPIHKGRGIGIAYRPVPRSLAQRDGFSGPPYQTGLYKQRLPTGELFPLISNDLGLGAADLIAIYEKRWCVEVFHKSLKQNAGLESRPPNMR